MAWRARPARVAPAIRWGVALIFAAVFTSAIINYSMRHGKLITLPTYDDVGYFADGLHRLQAFYYDGVPGLFRMYKDSPPHSPFESAMAVAAFAIFGVHNWSPYAMNGLLAIIYFVMVDRLLRGVPLWQRLLCLAFFATIPFVGMAVHEFRPDHAVALFTATGAFLLLCGPFVYGPRSRQIAAGVWFGIAMLTKPPVFPQTIVLGFCAIGLATASDLVTWVARTQTPFFRRPRLLLPLLPAVLKAWAAVLIPFILIPLPHYVHNGRQIYSYIHEILFGAFKNSYENHGTFSDQLHFYLGGPGGKIMLGEHLPILMLLLILGVFGSFFVGTRGDRARAAAMALLLIPAWLIPTFNKTQQAFFGLTFDTLLAFTVIFLLGRMLLAQRVRGHRAAFVPGVALAVALILGVWNFQWPTRSGNRYAGWVEQRQQIVQEIFDTIVRHSNFHHNDVRPPDDPSIPDAEKIDTLSPVVLFCGIGNDINPSILEVLAAERQVALTMDFPQSASTVPPFADRFYNADFIFAAQSGTKLIADFLPSSPIQDDLLAAVRARPEYVEIGKWTFMKSDRSMFLFKRLDFGGFTPIENLGDIEGPFPDYHLRAVRWGYGPTTRLKVTAPADADYQIYWLARSDYPDENTTIRLDGQIVAHQPVIGSNTQFSEAHIPLRLTAGEHEIELDYTHWHTTDAARPMAVLFQHLRIMPVNK